MTFEDFVAETRNAGSYAAYAHQNGQAWHIGLVRDLFDSCPSWHQYEVAVNEDGGFVEFLVPLSVLDGCDYEE